MPIGAGGGILGALPLAPSNPGGWVGDTADEVAQSPIDDYREIRFERWQTAADERTCPECAPLNWVVWEEGYGSYPPLHNNCRCQRVYAYSQWQVRQLDPVTGAVLSDWWWL